MNERKSFQTGITLIALVISIIIMLILAGVSLNATIGDNGIITQAQSAKATQEESKRREDLEYILYEYNSSSFLGQTNGITNYLGKLKDEHKIDDYLYTDNLIVKYENVYYEIEEEGSFYKIKNKLSDSFNNNDNEKNFIVTPDNITSGNVEINAGDNYVILDKVNGKNFNFKIPAGEPVTIKILGDMEIDNKEYPGRSAIELEDGATLNLYIYGNVKVQSSFAEEGEKATDWNAKGGSGGKAGIRVSKNSTLNMYGTGTLVSYGGNASNGNGTYGTGDSNTGGGGRRRCWSWNWWQRRKRRQCKWRYFK